MAKHSSLTSSQRERYKRNILLEGFGEAGQGKLLESKVCIVGLGGLGSPAALYLAAAGVGELGLVDGDRVDRSNLQRQILHGELDVDTPKTESARQSLERIRSDIRLDLHHERLTRENAQEILSPYDFVIEATDNFEGKFLVNDCCVRLGKPFSHGGILGYFGQAMTVLPGQSPCYRCVFQDIPAPGTYKTTDQVGVLGSVAGNIGAVQAAEAVKYLLGLGSLLTGRLFTYDALDMNVRVVELPAEPCCPMCTDMVSKRNAKC